MANHEQQPTSQRGRAEESGHSRAAEPEPPGDVSGSTRDPYAPTAGLAGDATEHSAPLAAPSGYELLDEIGSGGMGVVYRARDVALNRHVALKILHTRYATQGVAARRFNDEAAITGQLQHPGIPPIHQIGTLPDGRPFLAMKLIKGSTLEDLLKERTSPAEDRGRFLAVFEQVCQAVGYAHAHNVIHRDLKPANVMVGAFGEVQVMDWGLAKTLTADRLVDESATEADEILGTEIHSLRDLDSATQAGSILGTPAFMPPEQAGGEIAKIDTRSDVFGLGAILCVILTGKPPYAGKDGETARLMAIRGQLTDALSRLDGCGAEPELVAICKRCLSLDPADRPANGGEVASAVAAFRQDAEERAKSAEIERARAEVAAAEQRKRRRVQAALGLAFTALVVLGGAFAWWMQEQRQAREAEERDRLAAAERDVNRAIENAVARYAQAKGADKDLALWAEARAAALQAKERAAEAAAPAEVQDRITDLIGEIEQVEKNRRLVATLLEIQASMGDQITSTGNQDLAGAAAHYEQAFRDYGTDLFAISPQQGAELLRTMGGNRTVEIAAALDDWGYTLSFVPNGPERRAALIEVTRRLDPDSVRNRIRDAIIANDRNALKAIGDELDPAQQPVQTVNLISVYMNSFRGSMSLTAYSDSAEFLRRAQPHHPGDFQINHNLGFAYRHVGRPTDSLPYYLAAIAIRPKSATAWNQYALSLRDLGRDREAADAFRRVLALSPAVSSAYENLGLLLNRGGDRPGAIAAWKQALPLWQTEVQDHSTSRNAINGLRSTHIRLGNALRDDGDLEGAIVHYKSAIEADPKHPDAHRNLIAVWREQGKLQESIEQYLKALELDLKQAVICVNLGAALRAAKEWDGAIACARGAVAACRKSIELDPTKSPTRYLLASLLLAKGDVDGAFAAFDLADLPYTDETRDIHGRCWIATAALAAWLDQTARYDAVCDRALSLARETEDLVIAERVAKVCSLRPGGKMRQDAALALGRQAVEQGKGQSYFKNFLLALGMAEYRAGHFADAVKTLDLGPQTTSYVSVTADFYRAMRAMNCSTRSAAAGWASSTAPARSPSTATWREDPPGPLRPDSPSPLAGSSTRPADHRPAPAPRHPAGPPHRHAARRPAVPGHEAHQGAAPSPTCSRSDQPGGRRGRFVAVFAQVCQAVGYAHARG
jgi:eukaryotic-like serine/threonine-protein kinase